MLLSTFATSVAPSRAWPSSHPPAPVSLMHSFPERCVSLPLFPVLRLNIATESLVADGGEDAELVGRHGHAGRFVEPDHRGAGSTGQADALDGVELAVGAGNAVRGTDGDRAEDRGRA